MSTIEKLTARLTALENKVASIQKRLNGKRSFTSVSERRKIIAADVARLKTLKERR